MLIYSNHYPSLGSFINDIDEGRAVSSVHRTLQNLSRAEEEEELGAAYDILLDKVLGNSRYSPIGYPEWYADDETLIRLEESMRYPGPDDDPLWRVACRVRRT